MKISIITPNYNGDRFLEAALCSVLAQREDGVELEYIVVDGASSDGSLPIIDRYRNGIDLVISEPDPGPAAAINKGLRRACGEWIGWLNADDRYQPHALRRAVESMRAHPDAALCFGGCRIVNEQGDEIRRGITLFKQLFFPLSCRFAIQCINYISQPALFFRRGAMEKVGWLREDLQAAFDYDFTLRLWRHGGACRIPGPPVADFRWHPSSISGSRFRQQFKEEYDLAVADAGPISLQALLHWAVRWGIVASYAVMQKGRERSPCASA